MNNFFMGLFIIISLFITCYFICYIFYAFKTQKRQEPSPKQKNQTNLIFLPQPPQKKEKIKKPTLPFKERVVSLNEFINNLNEKN